MPAIYSYASRSAKSLSLSELLNLLGLIGISATLGFAFYDQFWQHELPCPLCLLQRLGLICIGLGFLMNIRLGPSKLHYGLATISAIISGIASARQILLHIVPGSGDYGAPLLGIHFYTWGLIAAIGTIFFIALILIIESITVTKIRDKHLKLPILSKIVILLFTLLVAANLIAVVWECGLGQCPDNPTQYQLIFLLKE